MNLFVHNTWNRTKLLYQNILNERENFPDAKIVVLYNNSMLKVNKSVCEHIYVGENEGHKLSCLNMALHAIRLLGETYCDKLVFSHDDVYLEDLGTLKENLHKADTYDVVCSRFEGIQNYIILEGIKDKPSFDFYTTPWCSFWKSIRHVVKTSTDDIVVGYPEIAINIKNQVSFSRCRIPTGSLSHRLGELCYHTSFVLDNDQCWDKINTWGHSHQFDTRKWFNEKWLGWNESTTDLHPLNPLNPPAWKRATKHNLTLPKELL